MINGLLNYDFFIRIQKRTVGIIFFSIEFSTSHRTRRIYHPHNIHSLTVPLDIYPNTYTAVDAVAYSRQCSWLRVSVCVHCRFVRAPGRMKREINIHVSAEYI